MVIRFYRERETGDLLIIEYRRGERKHDAIGTGIGGVVSSMTTTSASGSYLSAKCKRLTLAEAKLHPQWPRIVQYLPDEFGNVATAVDQ